MAQELEIKVSNALTNLARLKEELPQVALAKEQKQRGSGGYHKLGFIMKQIYKR